VKHSRQSLLRQAFCEIPASVAGRTLRPCSPSSFALLGDLGNPLVGAAQADAVGGMGALMGAVTQYIWIHSAPVDAVAAVTCSSDLPASEIRALGFELEMGEALEFLHTFTAASRRMAAALAETEEDDESAGKPAAPATAPTGSPPSSSPLEPQETPRENVISFGTPPSSGPLPTSMPQTSPMADDADGASPSMILPSLAPTTPE
jgi:hypothetical protein